MPPNYLTMSRQALYDLVWAKPMTEIAASLGISDVALAKRCAAVAIPVPPRGYWAKVQAGQTPPKTPLASRRLPGAPTPDVELQIPKREPDPPSPPKPAVTAEELAMRAKVDGEVPIVPVNLEDPHPAVKRTAIELKVRKVADFRWAKGERSGPIISIAASDGAMERALRIADAFLKAAEASGFPFQPDPARQDGRRGWLGPIDDRPRVGRLVVDGEPMRLRIEERRERSEHRLTEEELRKKRKGESIYPPAWDYSPTGDLRVHLTDIDGRVFVTRKDGARRKLENQISQVLHDVIDRAASIKRRSEEDRIAEEARRKRERAAFAQLQRRAKQGELAAELERQAGAWARARFLRRYVRAARRALMPGQTFRVKTADLEVDFLDWAERYIDQMDPLSPIPRDQDQMPNRSDHYGAVDEDLKSAVHRLVGQSWPRALKLPMGNLNDDKNDSARE